MKFQGIPEHTYWYISGRVSLGLGMRKDRDGETFLSITSIICPLKTDGICEILKKKKVRLKRGVEKWLPEAGGGGGEK